LYPIVSYTIPELIEKSSVHYAGRPALAMVGGKPVLFEELEPRSRRLAALLGLYGIEQGDKVALVSENRPEWGLAYFGIVRLGASAVPILTDFTGEQMANIVAHSGAKAVIVSKKFLQKFSGGCKAPFILSVEDLSLISGPEGFKAPSESEIAAATKNFVPASVKGDDLAAIVYTSGTTGLSKGVMLSHRNLVWNTWACRSIIVLNRRDRCLSILPLAHTYEFTIGFLIPLMQGSAIYYLDRPPSATALLPALRAVRPTIICSVPLVIEKTYRASILPALEKIPLYKNRLFRPLLEWIAGRKLYKTFGGRLRFFGVGGAPLAAEVEKFLRIAHFPYAIGYGLTETAPLIAGFAPFHGAFRSTGPALRGVELRVVNPKPGSGEGEIQARGPNVSEGYYKDPERTAEAFSKDGWFKTGDLGLIDKKGQVFVRGRLKTMILGASGENIYPEDVEAVLNRSPYVAESLVYGDSEGLTALVQLKPETIEELKARLRDGIEGAELKVGEVGQAVGLAAHRAGESLEDLERSAAKLLERIRKEANEKLASFSRIKTVRIEEEPFEKTPTQKIKRFLYPRKKS
jgi:long-chain acyl-CoA synthetase